MIRKVRVTDGEEGRVILAEAAVADTFYLRLKGLLGKKMLPAATGLIIKPCKAVHTLGMAFAIDVAFVNHENTICSLTERLPPNKLGKTVRDARYVIEAPAGTFQQAGVAVGDKIRLEACNEPD